MYGPGVTATSYPMGGVPPPPQDQHTQEVTTEQLLALPPDAKIKLLDSGRLPPAVAQVVRSSLPVVPLQPPVAMAATAPLTESAEMMAMRKQNEELRKKLLEVKTSVAKPSEYADVLESKRAQAAQKQNEAQAAQQDNGFQVNTWVGEMGVCAWVSVSDM